MTPTTEIEIWSSEWKALEQGLDQLAFELISVKLSLAGSVTAWYRSRVHPGEPNTATVPEASELPREVIISKLLEQAEALRGFAEETRTPVLSEIKSALENAKVPLEVRGETLVILGDSRLYHLHAHITENERGISLRRGGSGPGYIWNTRDGERLTVSNALSIMQRFAGRRRWSARTDAAKTSWAETQEHFVRAIEIEETSGRGS